MNVTPTLLCIPDISGFTRFMSEVDFKLSSEVIPSLLNNIIYSNELQLKVSEIEGDAVLFYRTGELPSLEDLIDQCKNFYSEFYLQMEKLTEKFKNNGDSVKLPKMLGLKIILHYGDEIGRVQIGSSIKLMGEDVITAHRLLKNDIESDEYILISEVLLSQYRKEQIHEQFDWSKLHTSSIKDEHLGTINFSYINLKPLN